MSKFRLSNLLDGVDLDVKDSTVHYCACDFDVQREGCELFLHTTMSTSKSTSSNVLAEQSLMSKCSAWWWQWSSSWCVWWVCVFVSVCVRVCVCVFGSLVCVLVCVCC